MGGSEKLIPKIKYLIWIKIKSGRPAYLAGIQTLFILMHNVNCNVP